MTYGDVGSRKKWGYELRWSMQTGGRMFATALFLALALPAWAGQPQKAPSDTAPAVVQISQQVLPPLAHVRFCLTYPGECVKRSGVDITNLTLKEQQTALVKVNLSVNHEMTPQEDDARRWGGDEWSLFVARGDCEDYALTKQKRLVDMGWASNRLRIATALTPGGVGHAVLIARLNGKDYVLDNLSGDIRPWNETGYRFLKIQSETDPSAWFSVADSNLDPDVLS